MRPAEFGSAAASASVTLLCVAAADFGGATYALRESAAARMTLDQFARWLWSKTLVILGLAPVAALTGAIAGGEISVARIASCGVFFVGSSLALIRCVPLRSALHFACLSGAMVISRLPSVAFILGMSHTGTVSPDAFVALLAGGSLLEAALYRRIATRRFSVSPRISGLVNPYRNSAGVGLAAAGSSIGSLDISLVKLTAGAGVAGEYAAVNRWMGPVGLISQAVTQAIFPLMSSATRESRGSSLKSGLVTVMLSFPIVAGVILAAPWLVSTLLGSAYQGAGLTLQILCVAIIVAMLCQPLNAALIAWNLERQAAASVIGSQIIQLVLQAVGASLFGAPGAAGGAVAGQIVTLIAVILVLSATKSTWRGHVERSPKQSVILEEPVAIDDQQRIDSMAIATAGRINHS